MEDMELKRRLKEEIDKLERKEYQLVIEKRELVRSLINIEEKIKNNDEELSMIRDLHIGKYKELLNYYI